MTAAPPSWRAGMKRAPCSVSALVTWKLPLPTTPKTVFTPASRARAVPIQCATVPRVVIAASAGDEGEDARRGAGAADDGQRGGDDDRARDREPVEVAELGEAVLARAEYRLVAGEGRGEAERLPGV